MYDFSTPPEHKKAVHDYITKGISLRQTARELGTSPQGAYSMITRIVRQMYLNGELEFKDEQ